MGFYIGSSGYYEGDKAKPSDAEVLRRPSVDHVYLDGAWVVDTEPKNVNRITRAQGKKQLIISGMYQSVKNFIDKGDASEFAKVGFYDENYWLIDDEFTVEAAAKIGINPEQLQQLFNEASKL